MAQSILSPTDTGTSERVPVSWKSNIPPALRALIAGGIGGVCEVLAVYPLDSTIVQIQTSGAHTASNPIGTFKQTLKAHGWRKGIYAGVTAPLMGVTPMYAISFCGYDISRSWLQHRDCSDGALRPLSVSQTWLAGFMSGIPITFLTVPIERAKILQVVERRDERRLGSAHSSRRYRGSFDVIRRLWRQNGIRAVYRGYQLSLLRDCPGCANYFLTYDLVKKFIAGKEADGTPRTSLLGTIVAGAAAHMAMDLPMFPVDVIKARVQASTGPTNIIGEARSVYLAGGWRAFYRGVEVSALKSLPAGAATLCGYELAMMILR